jgi:hypothetical protein
MAAPAGDLAVAVARAGGDGAPRSTQRRGVTAGAVAGAGFAVWALALGLRPLADNSFFTHLATGRLILERGIPRSDPYTFTFPGEPWVVQSWLASLVYGIADALGGARGLQMLTGALTLALTWVIWRLSGRATALIGRIGLMAAALLVGSAYWSERPLLFGLLFLGLTLLALDEVVDARWLVPVGWLWVNTHGSFPIGLVVMVAAFVGRRLDGERPVVERRVLGWASLGVALGAVNPLGPRLLTFPVALLRRQEALQLINEWQAPRFDNWGDRAYLLLVLVAVAALVARPSWRAAVPSLVAVAMASVAMRNLPVAAIVLVACAAPAFAGVGTVRTDARVRWGAPLLAAMLAINTAVVATALVAPPLAAQGYPISALGWLRSEGLLASGTRIVTRDVVGNFLGAAYGGAVPVYIDDRAELFGGRFMRRYADLTSAEPGWEQTLLGADPDVVLFSRDQPVATALVESERWQVVYSDPVWVVAVPRR